MTRIATMNPYEILGVRHHASKTEIELAYKGRRSQYHPDRYASEDAETIKWATAMIQQVNEAYALLTDPQARARAERSRAASAPPKAKPGHARRSDAASPNLREHLLRHLHGPLDEGHTFAAPDIPHKKLHAARGSYGDGLKPDDVVLLVDDTVFGSAKDGMLVTRTEVRVKEMFQEPVRFPFTRIQKIHSGGNRLNINGQQVLKFTMPDTGEMACVMAGLNDFLIAIRAFASQANEDGHEGEEDEDQEDEDQEEDGPDEGLIERTEEEMLRLQKSSRDPMQVAFLRMVSSLIVASSKIARMLEKNDDELSEEEEFVVNSDIFRFEVLIFILSDVLGAIRDLADERRATRSIALMVDLVIVPIMLVKERPGHQGDLSDQEKLDWAAQSSLFASFKSRMKAFGEARNTEALAAIFIEHIHSPIMLDLYEEDEQDAIAEVIGDLMDTIFDSETVATMLRRIQQLVRAAAAKYVESGT